MPISREFLLLTLTIIFGAMVLLIVDNTKTSVETLDYKDRCTELAASYLDKPFQINPIEYNEIQTDKAIDSCTQSLKANPSSNRLKYYLARSYESAQTMEGLLQAKKILIELSDLGYSPAQYELFLFGISYKELKIGADDSLSYLKLAADAGLSYAVTDYINILNDKDNVRYDPVAGKRYEKQAIAEMNLELFSQKPDLFFEKLNEWQVCYATILAPTGLSLPSLIFYEPNQLSPRGFELVDSLGFSPAQRKNAVEVCSVLQGKTPTNARDLALQISLPYLLHNEQLDANRVLDLLKENENLPDFAFLVTGFLYYSDAQDNNKPISPSLELQEYLLNWQLNFLNSNELYDFANGLKWVETLEGNGLVPGFDTLLTSSDFSVKFQLVNKTYPGFMLDFIYENEASFANYSTFSGNTFDIEVKYDFFCSKIVNYQQGKSISFAAEKLENTNITGFGEEDQTDLIKFCLEYSNENEFSNLETIAIEAWSEHYIYNNSDSMEWYVQKLSDLYTKSERNFYRNYEDIGEFSPRNMIVKQFVETILPNNELGYFDEIFLKKALISKDFLANPIMLLDFAMEVDRILDKGTEFTSLVINYLSDNFPFYLPADFRNNEVECSQLLHRLSSLKPISYSKTTEFFNDIYVDVKLDRLLSLNLKERFLSMSITTLEDAIELNTLSSKEDVFCQEMLIDQYGKPTSVTSSLNYSNSRNELLFDFRTSISMPEILLSNFFIKDYRVGKELRSNVDLTFDPTSLQLHRYPFINGQIFIPFDIIVKAQDVRYITLDVQDHFDTDISGLKVSLDKVEFSERENYPDAFEANIVLKVKNNYFIQLLKIVFPILVLGTVALTTLPRQKASSDEAQLSLAGAVMLSLIAYQFVVNALLPELPFLTSLDYFIYALFVSAAFSVVSNVITHIEYFDHYPRQEQLLVFITNIFAIALYLLGIILLVIAWFQSAPF